MGDLGEGVVLVEMAECFRLATTVGLITGRDVNESRRLSIDGVTDKGGRSTADDVEIESKGEESGPMEARGVENKEEDWVEWVEDGVVVLVCLTDDDEGDEGEGEGDEEGYPVLFILVFI